MVFLLQVMRFAKLSKPPSLLGPLSIELLSKVLGRNKPPPLSEGLIEDLWYISYERLGETTLTASKLSILQGIGCTVVDSEDLPWVHVTCRCS